MNVHMCRVLAGASCPARKLRPAAPSRRYNLPPAFGLPPGIDDCLVSLHTAYRTLFLQDIFSKVCSALPSWCLSQLRLGDAVRREARSASQPLPRLNPPTAC